MATQESTLSTDGYGWLWFWDEDDPTWESDWDLLKVRDYIVHRRTGEVISSIVADRKKQNKMKPDPHSAIAKIADQINSAGNGVKAHQCHCVGCCEKCGQCRTAPWHPGSCNQIAKLEEERRRIIKEAMGG